MPYNEDQQIRDMMANIAMQQRSAAQAHPAFGNAAELPRYKCHKEVWALRIQAIERLSKPTPDPSCESDGNEGGAIITPMEQGYAPFQVSAEYMRKHRPQVGGYYVVYKDGYRSFSPAAAFEDGYSRL